MALYFVSKFYHAADGGQVTKNDMPLHFTFQATQVSQEKILVKHKIAYFQHDSLKVLVFRFYTGSPRVGELTLPFGDHIPGRWA